MLTPRAEILLKTLINCYVSVGTPVGSKALAKESGLEVSSATIRNIMIDLENLGLIHSPHTSAGRVPTNKGYRFFVDTFIKVKPVKSNLMFELERQLADDCDPQQVLNKASDTLSQLTQFAGVVMVPGQSQSIVRQIEFLSLSGGRILVILITDDGRVQNRVLQLDRQLKPYELVEAANYFNQEYAGISINKLRKVLLTEMQEHTDEMTRIMKNTMAMANRFFDPQYQQNKEDVVLSGESNLFDVLEFNKIETMRKLFETFKTKQDLLELMDKTLKSRGVQIFIGEESGSAALSDCSLIAAPYELDDQGVGVLGVIGPTRMDYAGVISVVDSTSRLVSGALAGYLNHSD